MSQLSTSTAAACETALPPLTTAEADGAARDDWTSFLGLDSEYLVVHAGEDGFHIHFSQRYTAQHTGEAIEELRTLLDMTPGDWAWSVDLSNVSRFTHHFLNTLVAIGAHLHLRGGRLSLSGIRCEGMPSGFRPLFLSYCQSEGIALSFADSRVPEDEPLPVDLCRRS